MNARHTIPLIAIILSLNIFEANSQVFNFERTIPLSGKPKGISVKEAGVIYVALATTHQVLKIDKAGRVLLQLGNSCGSGDTQFNTPYDVEVDAQGNIYVADRGNKRVQVFAADGTFVRTAYVATTNVNGVTISPDGKLYIACDTYIAIVEGATLLNTITTLSSDQFRIANKVHFNQQGEMYVADNNSGIIKIASVVGSTATVQFVIKKKDGKNYYNRLGYVTTTSNGQIIFPVSEERAAETGCGVFRFTPTGIFIDTLSPMRASADPNRFNCPWGVGIDAQDTLFVADFNNSAIKVWKETDTQCPTVRSASVEPLSRYAVSFKIEPSEPVDMKYVVRSSTDAVPTQQEILALAQTPIHLSNTGISICSIPTPQQADLVIHYLLIDKANNYSICYTTPVFSTEQPLTISHALVADKSEGNLRLQLAGNDSGTLFVLVRPFSKGAIPPTISQLTSSTLSFPYSYTMGEHIFDIPVTGSSRVSLYLLLKQENEFSAVTEVIATPYSEIDLIRNRYRELLIGTRDINYTDPVIRSRYQSICLLAAIAHQKLPSYTLNPALPPFDLSGASQTADIALVRDLVGNVLFPLALNYHLTGTADSPNPDYHNPATLSAIISLYRYLESRNFVSGSVLPFEGGGVYLGLTGYYYASFLMRNELQQAGLFSTVIQMMQWGTRWVNPSDKLWGAHVTDNNGKTDGVRTLYNNFLLTQLTVADSTLTREAQMSYFKEALDNNLKLGSAWNGFLKPDYSGYHHLGMWGNAYVTEAIHVAAQMAWVTAGTSYAFSQTSVDNLANALIAYRDYSGKYDVSRGLCGRFPRQLSAFYPHIQPFAYLVALTSGILHTQLRDAFAQLYDPNNSLVKLNMIQHVACEISFSGGLGTLQQVQYLAKEVPYTPQNITLNRTFPYGAMQVHRRQDWLATVKGYNKYVWDFETNGAENWYGRNQSAGQLSIYAGKNSEDIVTAEASGVGYNGWDWSHIPGTTTFNMPLADMLWEAQQFEWAKFSSESFAGGVTTGQSGAYGMKYVDIRQAYDYNNKRKWQGIKLSARKSFFFFDDLIVALGSDINNQHTTYDAHTTIFQNQLLQTDIPINVNGTLHTGLSLSTNITTDTPLYLIDTSDNGYYLPHAKGLSVRRSTQISRNDRNTGATQGNYATAWLDHGKTTDGHYEFAIWVRGGARIATLAENASHYYTKLRCDSIAHIVTNGTGVQRGYAIFQQDSLLRDPFIRTASAPCMAMITSKLDQVFDFSVSNPDLGYYPAGKFPYQVWSIPSNKMYLPAPEQPVELILEDEWQAVNTLPASVQLIGYQVAANRTTLLLRGVNAESLSFSLRRARPMNINQPENNNFNLYPNPTYNDFTVSFSQPLAFSCYLRIFDATGREVAQHHCAEGISCQTISTDVLEAGYYLVKIGDKTTRLMIKK